MVTLDVLIRVRFCLGFGTIKGSHKEGEQKVSVTKGDSERVDAKLA